MQHASVCQLPLGTDAISSLWETLNARHCFTSAVPPPSPANHLQERFRVVEKDVKGKAHMGLGRDALDPAAGDWRVAWGVCYAPARLGRAWCSSPGPALRCPPPCTPFFTQLRSSSAPTGSQTSWTVCRPRWVGGSERAWSRSVPSRPAPRRMLCGATAGVPVLPVSD